MHLCPETEQHPCCKSGRHPFAGLVFSSSPAWSSPVRSPNMITSTPWWGLVGTSTNDRGVTFFALVCRGATKDDADYHELMSALKRRFGAVETGQLARSLVVR